MSQVLRVVPPYDHLSLPQGGDGDLTRHTDSFISQIVLNVEIHLITWWQMERGMALQNEKWNI